MRVLCRKWSLVALGVVGLFLHIWGTLIIWGTLQLRDAFIEGRIQADYSLDIDECKRQLRDGNTDERRTAVAALGTFRSRAPEVVPSLIGALSDPDPLVREIAVAGLGRLGVLASDAVPGLENMARADDDPGIREEASLALLLIHPCDVPLQEGQQREFLASLPQLIGDLKDKNLDVRKTAVITLCRLGQEAKKAIPNLTDSLQDEDPEVRKLAAEALKRIRGP